MKHRIAGIDPGKSGGIAVIGNSPYGDIPNVWPMPMLENDINLALQDYLCGVTTVYVEQVQPVPLFGARGNFRLGHNLGQIEAMLRVWGIPYVMVRPQEWQKLIFAGMLKPTDKRIKQSVLYCQRKYPALGIKKSHDGISDAICIAEYGRRIDHNKPIGG